MPICTRFIVVSFFFSLFEPLLWQVRFHYQTKTCYENEEQKVLDDSKKSGKPMELVIGKKFKFEVWEAIVKKMSLNEVAKFHVDKAVGLSN